MHLFINFILLIYTSIFTMPTSLDNIKQAASGLYFISETDSPLEVFQLQNNTANPSNQLLALSGKEQGSAIEEQELDYFLRNMVKVYPESTPEQKHTAQRFLQLQQILKEELSGIKVYRIGAVAVDAFIVGKLKDGTYAGLRTKLVET